MWFSVLGPLEVRESQTTVALGGPLQRSVLALLLVDAGHAVSADRLLTEIWGDDPPDGARDSLYTYISNLRGKLGKERIARVDGGYTFRSGADDVIDCAAFEQNLAEADRLLGSDPDSAVELIDRSLSLWRGRPYEGFEDLPSIEPEAVRVAELRPWALEQRFEAELRTGRTPGVQSLEALVDEHPYRERLWGLLARSLYRAGRQAESLRTLSRLRKLLAEELGLDPSPEIVRLEERILLHDPALEANVAVPSNLPAPVTSFIGRDEELAELDQLIRQHRLVTLVGPGGAGKTRLAIELAGRIRASFADGVWFVDLAPISGEEGVVAAVSRAMELPEQLAPDPLSALSKRLRPQTALVILDNCEHVADDVALLVTGLLSASPRLRVLATSRSALDVSGERRFLVNGLDAATESGDAAELFAARAGTVRPGFALNEKTRGAVVSICEHLDGMPLAIELAAARSDVLSPQEIDGYLQDRFRLLTDPQRDRSIHRSLQASLDWSYELLGEMERQEFDRLGVFEGSFSIGAATAVLETEAEVATVAVLRRLAGASFIGVRSGSTSLYGLLETMRLYAREHLHASSQWQHVVAKHDNHYLGRGRLLRSAIFGAGRTEARVTIEAELPDYEVAFDRFVVSGDLEPAMEMAWPLSNVWLFAGKLSRGLGRLENLIRASDGARLRERADTLAAASFLAMYVTRYDDAIRWSDEAIDIYREVADELGVAYALARRGHLAFSVGDVPGALAMLQESLEICDRIGYEEGSAWPLTLLAQARLWGGDTSDEVAHMLAEGRRRFMTVGDMYGQAHANMFIINVGDISLEQRLEYSEETIDLVDQPGSDPLIGGMAFHNLAFPVWDIGEQERAFGLNRLSARSALEMGTTIVSGMAFLQAGRFAGLSGAGERAAVMYGAGDRHFVMEKPPFYIEQLSAGIDAAIDVIGKERYEELYKRGSRMTIEEATEYLLAD